MLNKQKGNMYGFVTHTWNPIKGKCVHDCVYCYMKRFPQKPIRLDSKDIETNLGENKYIFVGSSTDIFAEDVSEDWIRKVLRRCRKYPNNKYLFQSKNTRRITDFKYMFPQNTILATTIETNKDFKLSAAPDSKQRAYFIGQLGRLYRTMLTIEPIFDFDLEHLLPLIIQSNPIYINIGADSTRGKKYSIPEPSKEKVQDLIETLKMHYKVNIKDNLKRIIGEKYND